MALTQIKTDAISDDAVTLAKQAAGTDGQIITYDASGNPTAVGPGTDGQVLTSTGAGSPPAFETLPTSGATLSGSTNNTVVTVTGANAMIGEATLTYDGTNLQQKQTGNTETSIILDSNRSAADNSIGGVVGKWDTETVADMRFFTDDDTTNKDNGYISFRTSTASGSLDETLRLKPNRDVQITDGNLIVASGHGIDFSATADGPQVSHASELFDDYEEGTWTVTLGNSVTLESGTDLAQYVKIGRFVWLTGQLRVDSDNSNANFDITNLPFASSGSKGESTGTQYMSVGTYDLNATANTIGNKLVIGDASQTAQLVNIVDDAGYARTSAIPDTSGFARSSDIPSLEGYARSSDIPDISNLATTDSLSGYVTTTDAARDYARAGDVTNLRSDVSDLQIGGLTLAGRVGDVESTQEGQAGDIARNLSEAMKVRTTSAQPVQNQATPIGIQSAQSPSAQAGMISAGLAGLSRNNKKFKNKTLNI